MDRWTQHTRSLRTRAVEELAEQVVGWTGQGYRECKLAWPGYSIPNAYMAFLNSGEKQPEPNILVRLDHVIEDHHGARKPG